MNNVAKIILYRGFNSIEALGLWCADRGQNDGNFGIKFDDIIIYGSLVDLYGIIILLRQLMSIRVDGDIINNLREFLDNEKLCNHAINVKDLASTNIAIDTVVLDQGMSDESFNRVVGPHLDESLDDLLNDFEDTFLECYPNTKPLLANMNHKLMQMEEWLDHDKKAIEGGKNMESQNE